MRYFLFLLMILLVFASENEKKQEEYIITDTKIALDTLMRYQQYKQLFFSNNELSIFKDETNEFGVAVVMSKKQICIFKQFRSKWQLCQKDTAEYFSEPHKIEWQDLNGDNYKDLKITHYEGAYDFCDTRVYLFQHKDSCFHHNFHFDLSEIEYNAKTGLVHSHSYVPHMKYKGRYKIIADTLQLVDEIECNDDGYCQIENVPLEYRGRITSHYIFQKNKKKLVKIVLNKTDTTQEAYDYFLNTLWKTDF